MIVHIEYDRSNRVCEYEGQVIALPIESLSGGQFFCMGSAIAPPHNKNIPGQEYLFASSNF